MGLLDKLKPQPRWKHADPAVRLEAVRELDDPVELAQLAETDPDATGAPCGGGRGRPTRRCSGVSSPSDADAEARDRAADRLPALATAPDTDDSDGARSPSAR